MSKEADILKIEHARYKKALRTIQDRYPASADAYVYAVAALNPPILPPPTIAELCAALHEFNRRGIGCNHSITIFSDGSASVGKNNFCNLHEALDFLNGGSHE